MAFLINRKAPSRIECLYSLLKFLNANYGDKIFSLEDCMYSREEDNVHNYCSLIEDTDFGFKCPYKESPLSDAGCYITNGKYEDTTKKKEVGNTVNALHGMGFLKRIDHDITITPLGKKFAMSDLYTQETSMIVKKAILSYGPVIGVIDEIDKIKDGKGVFKASASNIAVGYPSTEEQVYENGSFITISSGSTTDANTRSRSCYLSWLVTAGIIEPIGVKPDCTSTIPYKKYRSFLNADTLKARTYKLLVSPKELFNSIQRTEHPLDYVNLTKLTRALRENGQAAVREITMKYENRIQNRRFAIMFLLNKAFQNHTYLSFNKLMSFMESYPTFFIISSDNFQEVLQEELHIANVGGIPFSTKVVNDDLHLFPLVGLNLSELSNGAPQSIIKLLNTI